MTFLVIYAIIHNISKRYVRLEDLSGRNDIILTKEEIKTKNNTDREKRIRKRKLLIVLDEIFAVLCLSFALSNIFTLILRGDTVTDPGSTILLTFFQIVIFVSLVFNIRHGEAVIKKERAEARKEFSQWL